MGEEMKDRRERIVRAVLPHVEGPLRDELKEGRVSRERMRKMAGLLAEAFEELVEPDGMMNYCEKRVRDWVREGLEIDAVRSTDDPLLDRCVEIVRDTIVKKAERDALAKHLAEELVRDWKALPKDALETVGGEDGLIAELLAALDGGAKPHDEKIVNAILEISAILVPRSLSRLTDEQIDRLLAEGIAILKKIENKQSFWEPLLEWTRFGMTHLGVITVMRKSFTRLLLGDIILHSAGRGLGIKGKTTVTDFIVLVGVRVAEKILLDEADPAEARRIRASLERI